MDTRAFHPRPAKTSPQMPTYLLPSPSVCNPNRFTVIVKKSEIRILETIYRMVSTAVMSSHNRISVDWDPFDRDFFLSLKNDSPFTPSVTDIDHSNLLLDGW